MCQATVAAIRGPIADHQGSGAAAHGPVVPERVVSQLQSTGTRIGRLKGNGAALGCTPIVGAARAVRARGGIVIEFGPRDGKRQAAGESGVDENGATLGEAGTEGAARRGVA